MFGIPLVWTLVIAAVIVFVGGFGVHVYVSERRNARRKAARELSLQSQVEALRARVERAKTDSEDQMFLFRNLADYYKEDERGRSQRMMGLESVAKWSDDETLIAELKRLVAEYKFEQNYADHKQMMERFLTSWRRSQDASALAKYVYNSVAKYDDRLAAELGLSIDEAKAALKQYFDEKSAPLIAKAATSWESLLALQLLIDESKANPMSYIGIEPVAKPPGWNKWMARLKRKPTLADFSVKPYDEVSAGTVAALASDALRDRNLTKAQIALAYCNYGHSSTYVGRIRAGVGDYLYGNLSVFVAEHFPAAVPEATSD